MIIASHLLWSFIQPTFLCRTDDYANQGSKTFKQKREEERKASETSGDTRAWNSLFMRPDTVCFIKYIRLFFFLGRLVLGSFRLLIEFKGCSRFSPLITKLLC